MHRGGASLLHPFSTCQGLSPPKPQPLLRVHPAAPFPRSARSLAFSRQTTVSTEAAAPPVVEGPAIVVAVPAGAAAGHIKAAGDAQFGVQQDELPQPHSQHQQRQPPHQPQQQQTQDEQLPPEPPQQQQQQQLAAQQLQELQALPEQQQQQQQQQQQAQPGSSEDQQNQPADAGGQRSEPLGQREQRLQTEEPQHEHQPWAVPPLYAEMPAAAGMHAEDGASQQWPKPSEDAPPSPVSMPLPIPRPSDATGAAQQQQRQDSWSVGAASALQQWPQQELMSGPAAGRSPRHSFGVAGSPASFPPQGSPPAATVTSYGSGPAMAPRKPRAQRQVDALQAESRERRKSERRLSKGSQIAWSTCQIIESRELKLLSPIGSGAYGRVRPHIAPGHALAVPLIGASPLVRCVCQWTTLNLAPTHC